MKITVLRERFANMRHRVPRIILAAVGACVLINAIAIAITSNFNMGTVVTFALGAFLLSWGVFYEWVEERLPRWLRYAVAVVLAAVTVLISAVVIYGKNDSVSYKEDAVIVLGGGIHGETPSLTLQKRLDAAVEYYEKNPNAIIVVSGGQGPQEDITEALAMERYLIGKGIPADKIIKEERSTSTRENFEYSKEILDGYFDGEYSVAFVTSDFHIFRAARYAKMAGYEEVGHCHSDIKWHQILPSCLRECLAIVKLLVFRR